MFSLNSLPSVEQLLQSPQAVLLADNFGRPLTVRAIRETLETMRADLRSDEGAATATRDAILDGSKRLLTAWTQSDSRAVVNATGVILHTNLGRAPVSAATIAAMTAAAGGYSNLEFDLETGRRGQRGGGIGAAFGLLTGAEATLVVNNNASAVLLVLSALASRKGVAIARSQLVEIGGGFRMPDVMRRSGARLVEVGTTNKVRLSDYEAAFGDTQVVLRVHRSNFKIVGFTAEPDLATLVAAGHRAEQIVVDDLGSGALLDTAAYGLAHEPTVQESLAAGVDLVCVSGDKLMGGPQAGVILGKDILVRKIARHPLARAVRADKVTLAGVRATVMHYVLNEAQRAIPVWKMLSTSLDEIDHRARGWQAAIGHGEVMDGESTLGGGSLPGEALPTRLLALRVVHSASFHRKMRQCDPPVIGRVERGQILMDPRTVAAENDVDVIRAVRTALTEAE